ncbi:hypothetical protein SLS60_008428 [Paraconiothyrium brasiliense]|uniref:Tetratricopeptide repeat protein n=1 Tax=Paraconiothyrium brasiliense TaxID=300254 RepID=A0ABR3R0K3_9PLEO
MTFGYDADIVNFWGQAAQDGISGYAKDLLGKLSRKRQQDTYQPDRKIVFVVHSLGGLVTQRALIMSRESRHPHLQVIEACTVGICFLGTPHHGSDLAKWGSILTRIANIAKPANLAPVELLKQGSEMLRDVQEGFHNLLEKRKDEEAKIEIVCFYETLPLGRFLVVPKEKSQLAIEQCYRVEEAFPEIWVFWVHAATRARFEDGYRSIAEATKMSGWDDPKANILRLVYNWLSDKRYRRWLMVVDNADDESVFFKNVSQSRAPDNSDQPEELLLNFLPQSPNGSILFTSRSQAVAYKLTGDFDNIIEVKPMSNDDALALLHKKLGPIAQGDEATELTYALEAMPLALAQAAAFIKQRMPRMSLSNYIDKLRRSDRDRARLLENDLGDLRRDGQASNSIISTWHISFEHIREKRPTAARLLSLMSLFDRQGISESLLQGRYAKSQDDDADLADSTDGADFDDDIQTLTSFSLVRMSADGRGFEMHRLVQFSTKKWLELSNELELWKQTYVTLMDEICPNADYENWPKWQALFPHAEAVLNNKPKEAKALEVWTSVLYKASSYAREMGQYRMAYEMGSCALQGRVKVLGAEHEATLESFNSNGTIAAALGRYNEAETMMRQALEGRERVLGGDHPYTLTTFDNLGSVLGWQGRYKEAEAMHKQALEGRERVLGDSHPDMADSMSNLASTYHKQGLYKDAEALQVQVLQNHRMQLGVEHPNTLASMNNLAMTYSKQGWWKDAEALQVQVAEISRMQLGADHPNTLTSMNNLAWTYYNQDRWKDAEALQVQATEIRRMQLGAEHPDTLASMNNLSLTYKKLGRWNDVEELQVQVLEIERMKLGFEHPSTLISMSNLAVTLKDMGYTCKAIAMMEDCYEARLKVLGDQHPDTIDSRKWLGKWRLQALKIDEQSNS